LGGRRSKKSFAELRNCGNHQKSSGQSIAFTTISDRKQAENAIVALKRDVSADLAAMRRLHKVSTRLLSQDNLQDQLAQILDAASVRGVDGTG
jgi:hypothetical protein